MEHPCQPSPLLCEQSRSHFKHRCTISCIPSSIQPCHSRRLETLCSQCILPYCRYAFCPNLTIIDTPGFILKVRPALCYVKAHAKLHHCLYIQC